MKINDFLAFIEKGVFEERSYLELSNEVNSYIESSISKKDVKYIYGERFDENEFTRKELLGLLNLYLDSKILEWDLEYILNYIELGFDIPDEKTEEVIFNFSDPYLNYSINIDNIKKAVSFLKDDFEVLELSDDKSKVLRSGYRSVFSNTLSK